MQRQVLASLGIAVLAAAWPRTSVAQEHHPEAFHANHVALFTGGTTESSEGLSSTHFSVGLDYERRLSHVVGVGLGGEWVFGGESREGLIGVDVVFRPVAGLGLAVGPGLEFAKERLGEGGTEVNAGLRVGILYGFELGHEVSIIPKFFTDFFEGKEPTFVWGLAFGLGF